LVGNHKNGHQFEIFFIFFIFLGHALGHILG